MSPLICTSDGTQIVATASASPFGTWPTATAGCCLQCGICRDGTVADLQVVIAGLSGSTNGTDVRDCTGLNGTYILSPISPTDLIAAGTSGAAFNISSIYWTLGVQPGACFWLYVFPEPICITTSYGVASQCYGALLVYVGNCSINTNNADWYGQLLPAVTSGDDSPPNFTVPPADSWTFSGAVDCTAIGSITLQADASHAWQFLCTSSYDTLYCMTISNAP